MSSEKDTYMSLKTPNDDTHDEAVMQGLWNEVVVNARDQHDNAAEEDPTEEALAWGSGDGDDEDDVDEHKHDREEDDGKQRQFGGGGAGGPRAQPPQTSNLEDLSLDEVAQQDEWQQQLVFEEGKEVSSASFHAHQGQVECVALSPDGKVLATSSEDRTAKLWDAQTGRLIHVLRAHQDTVKSVSFSFDNRLVATTCEQTIYIWSVSNGRLLKTLEGHAPVYGVDGHRAMISSVSFSPTDFSLLSGAADNMVKLWDPLEKKVLATLKGHTDHVVSVAFSHRGRLIASASRDKTVRVWSLSAVLETEQKHKGPQRPMHKALRVLRGHSDWVFDIAFSANDRLLASASRDATAIVWKLSTGEKLQELQHPKRAWVFSVSFLPGMRGLVTGAFDNSVRVWDVQSGAMVRALEGHTGPVFATAHSMQSDLIVSTGADQSVRLWNTRRSQELIECIDDLDFVVEAVSFSDGSPVVARSAGQLASVYDLRQRAVVFETPAHEADVSVVSFSHGGTRLVTRSGDATVKVFDHVANELVRVAEASIANVSAVAFASDDRLIASASRVDKAIKVFDANAGALLRTLRGHQQAVNSMAFNEDGTMLVTGSDDLAVHLWSISSGKLSRRLLAHNFSVNSVAFSADGSHVASGSVDGMILVWSVSTGQITRMFQHGQKVVDIAFAEDCFRLASTDGETVRVWNYVGRPSMDETWHYLTDTGVPDGYPPVLLKVFPQLIVEPDEHGETLLHRAARSGNVRVLKLLLETGGAPYVLRHASGGSAARNADPNLDSVRRHKRDTVPDPYLTPLRLALDHGHLACVRLILQYLPYVPLTERESLVYVLPELAQQLPRDFVSMLHRLGVPSIGEQFPQVQEGCKRVKLHEDEEFMYAGASSPSKKGLWLSRVPAEQVDPIGGGGVAVEAHVAGIPGLTRYFGPSRRHRRMNPLRLLLDNKDVEDGLDAPMIRHAIEFKWQTYGRHLIVRQLLWYVLLVALFTVSTLFPTCASYTHGMGGFLHLLVDCCVAALALFMTYRELVQVYRQGVAAYFGVFWNVVDFVTLSMMLLLAPFHALCLRHQIAIEAITVVLLWFKLIDFARGFKSTGLVVKMMTTMIARLGFFLAVLAVLLVAFSHAFYVLYRDVEQSEFGNWWVLFRVYQLMLTDEFSTAEFETSSEGWTAAVLTALFTLVVAVFLLNLLVALMVNVYSELRGRLVHKWFKERVRILLELEDHMMDDDRDSGNFPVWLHILSSEASRRGRAGGKVVAALEHGGASSYGAAGDDSGDSDKSGSSVTAQGSLSSAVDKLQRRINVQTGQLVKSFHKEMKQRDMKVKQRLTAMQSDILAELEEQTKRVLIEVVNLQKSAGKPKIMSD